jgi:hypothetical protein
MLFCFPPIFVASTDVRVSGSTFNSTYYTEYGLLCQLTWGLGFLLLGSLNVCMRAQKKGEATHPHASWYKCFHPDSHVIWSTFHLFKPKQPFFQSCL